MLKVYGIKHCTTIKKTLALLDNNAVPYVFIDYKKQPPTFELIEQWLATIHYAKLINQKGTTWRKFSIHQQTNMLNQQDVDIQVMLAYPSLIKRPIVQANDQVLIGLNTLDTCLNSF